MRIRDQLNQLQETLHPYARMESAGAAEVATDPVHLFALLGEKPGGLRIGILFSTEDKRGDYEEAGFVERRYLIVISRAKGFTLVPADSLVKGAAGARPMFDLVEEVRDLVRAISFSADTTEVTPNYLGAKPYVTPNGVLTDAMQLEISIGTQLPAIVA